MSPSPKTVFITGANRGIGLGIVRELLKNSEIEHIIAGARNVADARDLQELAKSDARLHLVSIDVESDDSIKKAVDEVRNIVGANGLNLLINNAGVNDFYKWNSEPNRHTVIRQIDVNAVGTLLLSQQLLPLLRESAAHVTGDELSVRRAAIVNIGSNCSSQALNEDGSDSGSGGLLAYKMSKVAMLSFARTLVADFRAANIPILVTTIHPGWVLTDMGGENAEISINESVSNIVNNLQNLNGTHAGGLFSRELEVMPF